MSIHTIFTKSTIILLDQQGKLVSPIYSMGYLIECAVFSIGLDKLIFIF